LEDRIARKLPRNGGAAMTRAYSALRARRRDSERLEITRWLPRSPRLKARHRTGRATEDQSARRCRF